jgi:hypothetical protein
MALGSLLGAIGTGLAKAAANYTAEKKKTTPTNKTTTSKTTTTTKSTTPKSTGNEHADYINQNYAGGLNSYTKTQQDRYNKAYQTGDYDLLQRLDKDALRVGYNLSIPQNTKQQELPSLSNGYSQRTNDLLSAVENYQSQVPDIPYPDMGDYNFNGIQKQLNNLTKDLNNYEGANYMGIDEALARANSQLGGMYNSSLDKTLDNYNKNATSRGMFGQLPTESLKQNAIAESELNKASAINTLGSNLYSQDLDRAQTIDQNYYNQMNQLANLLGQQYNSESGRYQADVNRYTSDYNVGRQQDQDYYNNINRQLDLLNNQYNYQNNEQQKIIETLGAYSNDYQAQINALQNDGDTSNDWQIPYLNILRNNKITGQQQSQAQAEAKNQSQLQDLALAMFKELGYAEPWMADILGINPGQYTQSYTNMLADNTRKSSGSSTEKEWTPKDSASLFKDASDLAKTLATLNKSGSDTGEWGSMAESAGVNPNKKEYTEADIQKLYYYLYELYNTDPADAMLLEELQKSQNLSEPTYYSNPATSILRNYLN